jgi:hypothetical protein
MRTQYTPIFVSVNGRAKMVGTIRPGGILQKTVKPEHMLQQPRAWALDVGTLDEGERLGLRTIQLDNDRASLHYTAPLSLYRSHGFPVNRGFGPQIGLLVVYFSINGKPPEAAPTRPKVAAQAAQLSMFR